MSDVLPGVERMSSISSTTTHPVLLPVLCVVLLRLEVSPPRRPLAIREARGLVVWELNSELNVGGGGRNERKGRGETI